VVGVVEVFEDLRPLGQVVQPMELLGAKEALVEHVIEVLDDTVAPRLGEGDEAHPDPKGQAQPDRQGQDPATALQGLTVVELGHLGHPEPAPQAHQPSATARSWLLARISMPQRRRPTSTAFSAWKAVAPAR
jgi:hypothetical protein